MHHPSAPGGPLQKKATQVRPRLRYATDKYSAVKSLLFIKRIEFMESTYSTFDEAFQLSDSLPLVVFNPHRQNVPIKLWLRELEEGAREQIFNLSRLEVVRGHVAIMPDAHMGIGCSVGTVFATSGAVVPSTVGVDLGCGMIALRFPDADTERCRNNPAMLKRLHKEIRDIIPTGSNEHDRPQEWEGFHEFPLAGVETVHNQKKTDFEQVAHAKAPRQLGSLGGGNHFIELCVDEEEKLWFMVHSGSRGIGNLIGTHYMHVARQLCNERGYKRPKDLDWLPLDSNEGQQYLKAVAWSQEYARQNRHHMVRALMKLLKHDKEFNAIFHRGEKERILKVENHHNFVQEEEHFGEKVWVHRKGAVSAQVGEWGILPGSMATGSYIVKGKGNTDSLCSCAHGSGRKMSRNAAKKNISLKEVEESMKGIVGEDPKLVHDEAPQAYKDLGLVMSQQTELIEQMHRLKPLLNVKGY